MGMGLSKTAAALHEVIRPMPVADVHAHPYLAPTPLDAATFTDRAAFGGGSEAFLTAGGVTVTDAIRADLQQTKRSTVYFQRLLHDTARFLACEPTFDAVLAARNARVTTPADAQQYVSDLYADAGITTQMLDFGFPQPPLDLAEVRASTPASTQIIPIYRIEPLIADLLHNAQAYTWAEARQTYDDAITRAIRTDGYRGVKSIIAYRTGLAVSPLSRSDEQGRVAWDAIRRGVGDDPFRMLRDHLLCRALERCMDLDVPMQIHTGMGDWEVQLPAVRPALLQELLRDPLFRACRVLLVHTGYPYHREAAYLANVLPRVYLDLSEGIPFAGAAAARIIAEVLEMAPLNRVCYGSDAFALPEITYSSAILGKQALAVALGELVDGGFVSGEVAKESAARILSETALELYGVA